jgi:hypothetical protein
MLPTDRSLWQSQAQADALFIDGHCGYVGPNDGVASASRFQPEK